MSVFLTLAIYSVRVASDMPPGGMPWISIYFFLSIFYTLIVFIWFMVANFFTTKNYLPKWLESVTITIKYTLIKKEKAKIKTIEDTEEKTLKPPTSKCSKCETCQECKTDKVNDEKKKKDREERESLIGILNYLMFSIIFLCMLISNLVIWILISK